MPLKDTVIRLFLEATFEVALEEDEGAVAGAATTPGLEYTFSSGWGTRLQIHHPPLQLPVQECLNWTWNFGERTSSKFNSSSALEVLPLLGTQKGVDKYTSESLWRDAFARTGGCRVIRNADVPEEWRVRKYYGQLSTGKKKAAKQTADNKVLTHEQLGAQLRELLPQHNYIASPECSNLDCARLVSDILQILTLDTERRYYQLIQRDLKDITYVTPKGVTAVLNRRLKHAVISVLTEIGSSGEDRSTLIVDEPQEQHEQLIDDEQLEEIMSAPQAGERLEVQDEKVIMILAGDVDSGDEEDEEDKGEEED
ncbi:hypothetical protein B484DRAFT_471455 [Ochromonadaceae sp. CCMP2298]|nr:hypothetical protein B484DRAFT_471455 [Ochromonadaceae sp. CCMP2298]